MSTPRFHRIPRRLPGALIVFAILAVAGSSLFIARSSKQPVTARASGPQVKRKSLQPDLPGTINGTLDPANIPDTIAYELFMRSISDYPSKAAFKDSGLSADQMANVLSYAQSFELAMSSLDQAARELKAAGANPNQLAKLQKKKEAFLARDLSHFMPLLLGAEGEHKLRSHISDRVKTKTKRIPGGLAKNSPTNVNEPQAGERSASRNALAFRHHALSPSPGDGVYVYCNSWQDGDNVYGSGTLTSDYGDYNQYLVTTTVIAPDGIRSSTSQAGWDYAAVTGTEYLSFNAKRRCILCRIGLREH